MCPAPAPRPRPRRTRRAPGRRRDGAARVRRAGGSRARPLGGHRADGADARGATAPANSPASSATTMRTSSSASARRIAWATSSTASPPRAGRRENSAQGPAAGGRPRPAQSARRRLTCSRIPPGERVTDRVAQHPTMLPPRHRSVTLRPQVRRRHRRSMFPGIGTVVNVAAVLLGAALGVLLGNRLPQRTRELVTDALGLVTLLIAATSAMAVLDPGLSDFVGSSAPMLIVLGALLVGGIVGSLLRIEAGWRASAAGCSSRLQGEGSSEGRHRFIEGFVDGVADLLHRPAHHPGFAQRRPGQRRGPALPQVGPRLLRRDRVRRGFGWGVAASVVTVVVVQGSLTCSARCWATYSRGAPRRHHGDRWAAARRGRAAAAAHPRDPRRRPVAGAARGPVARGPGRGPELTGRRTSGDHGAKHICCTVVAASGLLRAREALGWGRESSDS